MDLTSDALKKIIPAATATEYFPALSTMLPKYQVNTANRIAYFLANVLHESNNFKIKQENLNYTTLARIKAVFKGPRAPLINATLVKNPEGLANAMYGGTWGKKNLGNTEPGDGWKFRGRGALQTTGRTSYASASQKIFGDNRLLDNPDLLLEPIVSIEAAAFEFKSKGCNAAADANDFNKCVKAINGGLTNMPDRESRLAKIRMVIK